MTFIKTYNKGAEINCIPIAGLKAAKKWVENNTIHPDHKVVFSTEHINKMTNEKFENTITLKFPM